MKLILGKNQQFQKATLTFGTYSWRIESCPINGKSNLKLFSNGELIFEGTYGELINVVKNNKE